MSQEVSNGELSAALLNAPAGSDCPPDGTLFDAAHGQLDAEALGPLLDHVAGCGLCATSWSMARRTVSDNGSVVAPAPEAPANRGWGRSAWVGVALAAAAVLTLSVSLLDTATPPTDLTPTFRDATEANLTSAVDGITAPVGAPLTLEWDGPQDGSYDVVVTTADLQPVDAAGGVPTTRYVIPAQRLNLPHGTVLHWRVTGQRADGQALQSATFTVTLTAED